MVETDAGILYYKQIDLRQDVIEQFSGCYTFVHQAQAVHVLSRAD